VAPRRVLTLAYHFPPVGGAGVQRMVQLARRLPALGWEQTVITGPGVPDSHWRPHDDAIGAQAGASVLRMDGPEPPHDVRWEGRLERWLRRPSRWRNWWAENVVALAEAAGDVDVVHASLAPYSTAESAIAVARRLGRPLILDLEDPWALDEMLVYPTRLHRRLERRRMRRVLAQADLVVMNTPEARERVLREFPRLAPGRVTAIPNAYDPRDYADGPPDGASDVLRIVHTGSLHTASGYAHRATGRARRLLGGAVPGVDFLTRSHVFLLEAVERVLAEHPGRAIEVHLAGVFTPADRDVAARYPFVRLHEFVPHRETIALLRSADLLFLPMHDLPAGTRAGLIPQKTYEYLAAGRPILAAVPDGDARDLLGRSGVARLCRPADVSGMAEAVRAELRRKTAGEAPPHAAPAVLADCSADRLARQLAAAYESLAGPSRKARLGAEPIPPARGGTADPALASAPWT
jgi:glycosyltransferase involved in cell wall biosynthesis